MGSFNKLNDFGSQTVTVNTAAGNWSSGFLKWLTGNYWGDVNSTVYLNKSTGLASGYLKWLTGNYWGDVNSSVFLSKGNWNSGFLMWLTGNYWGTITAKVNLVAGSVTGFAQAITNFFFKAGGGIITAAGRSLGFASGGLISGGGRPNWWSSVQKYAAGTSRAHGTLFAAGEAGPEIVGHINGRTEILNKSQLAQTMYSAVASGMLYALSKVRLSLPAVAAGGAVPYEVAARIAETGEAIEATLNANNEDLIQTIISVIGAQTSAIVAALQQLQHGGAPEGMSLRQIIDGLNRQTQMFGVSPLI